MESKGPIQRTVYHILKTDIYNGSDEFLCASVSSVVFVVEHGDTTVNLFLHLFFII